MGGHLPANGSPGGRGRSNDSRSTQSRGSQCRGRRGTAAPAAARCLPRQGTRTATPRALAGGRDETGGEPPDAPPLGEDDVPSSPRADTYVMTPTPPEASRAQAALVSDERVMA